MPGVHDMTLCQVAESIRTRERSSVAVTEAYLERIERYNPKLNAYTKIYTAQALARAREADRELARGEHRGPLHGVPIALKDIIDVAGDVTTAGGVLLPDEPAGEDAEVIVRLKRAGAVLLGKLNLHEYAWGGTTDNHHFGRCYNPWKEGYSPGGSSGGSGAAVAAGLCAGALGTDTLGSVRIPSSYCGCVGIKPTFGLVSKRRVYPLSWALDTVGPLAACVEDAARMLEVIAGPDPRDPDSAMREIGDLALDSPPRVEGLRLGVIQDFALAHDGTPAQAAVREAVEEAIGLLVSLGARRVDLEVPEIEDVIATAYDIVFADGAAIHGDHLARHPEKIGANVRERFEKGAAMTAAQVALAHRRRVELRHRFAETARSIDAIVLPTTITPAHAFDPKLAPTTGRYTSAFNLLGYAAISLPCGFTAEGLPIGLQIAVPPFGERVAVTLARAYEAATDWHRRRPEGFDFGESSARAAR